jgi:hypothetical protein
MASAMVHEGALLFLPRWRSGSETGLENEPTHPVPCLV